MRLLSILCGMAINAAVNDGLSTRFEADADLSRVFKLQGVIYDKIPEGIRLNSPMLRDRLVEKISKFLYPSVSSGLEELKRWNEEEQFAEKHIIHAPLRDGKYVGYIYEQIYQFCKQNPGLAFPIIDIDCSDMKKRDRLGAVLSYLFDATEFNQHLWPLSEWISPLLCAEEKDRAKFLEELKKLEAEIDELNLVAKQYSFEKEEYRTKIISLLVHYFAYKGVALKWVHTIKESFSKIDQDVGDSKTPSGRMTLAGLKGKVRNAYIGNALR